MGIVPLCKMVTEKAALLKPTLEGSIKPSVSLDSLHDLHITRPLTCMNIVIIISHFISD